MCCPDDCSSILIVDDTPINIQVLAEVMRREYRSKAANRARSAFLVNLIQELRTPINAIMGITTIAFDEDRELCLAAGMNDHIAKPVDPDLLYETLLRWLQRTWPRRPEMNLKWMSRPTPCPQRSKP